MAKASITSLTDNSCKQHVAKRAYRRELSCSKIIGFHLQTLKSGACWRFRYNNFNGKTRIINLGKFTGDTANRLSAAEKAINYRNMVQEGKDPNAEKNERQEQHRIAEAKRQNGLLGKYLNGVYTQHQGRKVNQGKHTIEMIRKHFGQWADRPMDSICVTDLKYWQASKEQEGLSHSTIKRAFGALRTMFRHAVRERILLSDPSIHFQLSPPAADEKQNQTQGDDLKTRRMLTKTELTQLRNGLELYKQQLVQQRENSRNHGKPHLPSFRSLAYPHWFFPFFELAAYSGLRTGDLYSLNWQELNLNFKRLVKTPNKTRHHNSPIKVDLPLNPSIFEAMEGWHTQLGSPEYGLVFPSPVNGNQMDKNAHITHWKKVIALGGIKSSIDFYSLRHHYISTMVAGGIPMFTVARLAGHKSVKMIEQHYGHLAPHTATDALALVAGGFEPTSNTGGVAHG